MFSNASITKRPVTHFSPAFSFLHSNVIRLSQYHNPQAVYRIGYEEGQETFTFSKASRPDLGTNQDPS